MSSSMTTKGSSKKGGKLTFEELQHVSSRRINKLLQDNLQHKLRLFKVLTFLGTLLRFKFQTRSWNPTCDMEVSTVVASMGEGVLIFQLAITFLYFNKD